MKKSMLRKVLLLACSAVLLVCLSVGATLAYLTDTKTVTNTFTVGKVEIDLDEAKVDVYGKAVKPAERVKQNSYKLLPAHEYTKDPTVTVKADSEPCYVKMTVTITKSSELDTIFGADGANLRNIFKGFDDTKWEYKGNTENTTDNVRVYEFWYKTVVDARTEAKTLEPLFTSIVVPESITNAQLNTISDMTITAKAYAIQADGFADAADAWAKY